MRNNVRRLLHSPPPARALLRVVRRVCELEWMVVVMSFCSFVPDRWA
jgi:hypothetical protein